MISILEYVLEWNSLVVLEKTNLVAHLDLFAEADKQRTKIGQNTKVIALVISILECISDWNEIMQSSSAWKDEFSGNTYFPI